MAVYRSAIPDRGEAAGAQHSARRDSLVAVALVCLALALIVAWWRDARPVSVTDGVTARLPCVSYAPSKQSGDSLSGVTVEQLRRDLALLTTRTHCVRTYTVSEGFDQVPAVGPHEPASRIRLSRNGPSASPSS